MYHSTKVHKERRKKQHMQDTILLGRDATIFEVSAVNWKRHLTGARHHSAAMLGFMTEEHHLVRNFAVRELPRNQGRPLMPENMAHGVNLRLARVNDILDDLEKHLFFLVRNAGGEVSWAFPVTSD